MCCATAAFLTLARLLVLVLESWTAVRAERANDEHLVQLCREGAAQESARMRSACLAAQAERASPVLLKAVLRAFKTAFNDFADSMSSPTRVILLILFVLSGIAAPVVRAVVDVMVGGHEKVDEQQGAQHVVVLTPGYGNGYGFPRLLTKRRAAELPFGDNGFDEEENGVVEQADGFTNLGTYRRR